MYKRMTSNFIYLLVSTVIVAVLFIFTPYISSSLGYNISSLGNHIAILVMELLAIIFFAFYLIIGYIAIKDIVTNKTHPYLLGLWTQEKKAEKWAIALGWWIPRKYRGALVGDILEDCHEMREAGCSEWRIRVQAIWQWAIGVLTLVPNAMIAALWRIVSPPK
jgi:hypothetical protein